MYEDLIQANTTSIRITFDELLEIILRPTKAYLKYSGDEETIYIENHIVTDKYIHFDERIHLSLRLTFKSCFFASDYGLTIWGGIYNNYVNFEDCYFTYGIDIHGGKFKKELNFPGVHTPRIAIHGGELKKVKFYPVEVDIVWISGGKFESFEMSGWKSNTTIGKITIINDRGEELGNISIGSVKVDDFHVSGRNKNIEYSFGNIECNNIHIGLINEGSLSFFGIKPLEPKKGYFEIIKANLNKAQFYRVDFSDYKELILIDSFIADCLFIACRWQNNIRAIYGPGYGTFEESLKKGRPIEAPELYSIKEAYRQLRISMEKHSDKIQETKFYAEEMNIHNQLLPWVKPTQNAFWDKLILHWSKTFSDYGQSFIKPLFWLLVGNLIFFCIAVFFRGLAPLSIDFVHPSSQAFKMAFQDYFIYMNPLRKVETSFSGYLIVIDILMRIWSSYMIYNIIRASRRFIN